MTDRPILFSGPMVRALLDGRKTQTRRLLKHQPPDAPNSAWNAAPQNTAKHEAPYLDAYCGERRTEMNPRGMSRNWHWWTVDDRPGPIVTQTHYAPGDRLWVRENWGINHYEYVRPKPIPKARPEDMTDEQLIYFATEDDSEIVNEMPRCPSIHMPRWASRITLTVTDVRVQRLQDISRGDAMDEGCPLPNMADGPDPRDWFADLWDSLNAKRAPWDSNPWVAAYTFTVEQRNIDQQEPEE